MSNTIFSGDKVTLTTISEDAFSEDGYKVLSIVSILKSQGYDSELAQVKLAVPKIVPSGVQDAKTGIIQDPAGSAVGDSNPPAKTMAGGGSRAIYKDFPDLLPIPKMPSGGAVMNGSTGAGHRVLHSYSPDLNDPFLFNPMLNRSNNDDRRRALNAMTNAYINAFLCANDAGDKAGSPLHGTDQINLSALSGNIFAGNFKDFSIGHLQPSYTICAVLLAQAYLIKNNQKLMDTALYYYTGLGNGPYNAATGIISGLIWK